MEVFERYRERANAAWDMYRTSRPGAPHWLDLSRGEQEQLLEFATAMATVEGSGVSQGCDNEEDVSDE